MLTVMSTGAGDNKAAEAHYQYDRHCGTHFHATSLLCRAFHIDLASSLPCRAFHIRYANFSLVVPCVSDALCALTFFEECPLQGHLVYTFAALIWKTTFAAPAPIWPCSGQ